MTKNAAKEHLFWVNEVVAEGRGGSWTCGRFNCGESRVVSRVEIHLKCDAFGCSKGGGDQR